MTNDTNNSYNGTQSDASRDARNGSGSAPTYNMPADLKNAYVNTFEWAKAQYQKP